MAARAAKKRELKAIGYELFIDALSILSIKWLERYAKDLNANGCVLMLADVDPGVIEVLKKSGALEIIGSEHVFPATTRILAAEKTAWQAAEQWLQTVGSSSAAAPADKPAA